MTPSVLIHPQFDPIAFSLGPLAVRWYGLMYLVAFAAVLILGRFRLSTSAARSIRMDAKALDDLLLFGVLGVLLGGRLGYVLFYKPEYYLANPAEIIAIWQGGMAFHGGMLGVILAVALFAWRRRISFLAVGDFLAPLVPLGLAAGRSLDDITAELGHVAEGVRCVAAVRQIATEHHVAMPIVDAVARVLFEQVTPQQAIHTLLSREARDEAIS